MKLFWTLGLRFYFFLPKVLCGTGWFWHVTDIHYDPTYSDRHLSCYVYANVSNPGIHGDYKCDSPWSLATSSIHAMAKIKSTVDFILWTGDTVLHARDEELSNARNNEIIENVTSALKSAFPGIPIYATFGNHDYHPSDQYPGHNNQLYNATLLKWMSWISDPSQDEPFLKGGYYTAMTRQGLRIVALNTNLYYIYNRQVENETDPGGQLFWLNKTLTLAQKQNDKVIVTAHIPFGVQNPGGKLSMFEKFHRPLVNILQSYADIIVGMHFGHDHSDSFKVMSNSADIPVVPVFMAPSVTPAENHNPAIRLVKYDRPTGRHLDIEQYFLDLKQANANGSTAWKLEYIFKETYGVSDISAASLVALSKRMKNAESSEFKKFWNYHRVSLPLELQKQCDLECQTSFICGITVLRQVSFDMCVRNGVTNASNILNSPYTVVPAVCLLSILICLYM